MIDLFEKTNYYLSRGYSRLYAQSKVTQDIILSQIAKSNLRNNITIKGGVVLFNMTGDKRRATEDLDLDFIRYSIDDISINIFVKRLEDKEMGIKIKLIGRPIILKHQSYQGKRIIIEIIDHFNNVLKTKIDIGVHKKINIKQDEYLFNFESLGDKLILQINSKEQIFVEKLTSLLYHGIRSTRYKDIFDMYYFINDTIMEKDEVYKLINEYIINKINNIQNINDIYKELERILNNSIFQRRLLNTKYNWININPNDANNTILRYIYSLIFVEV